MPGNTSSRALDLTNNLVAILEEIYRLNGYRLDRVSVVLKSYLEQADEPDDLGQKSVYASLRILMNTYSTKDIDTQAAQILTQWQGNLTKIQTPLKQLVIDALEYANHDLGFLIEFVNSLEPSWQHNPEDYLNNFIKTKQIENHQPYQLLDVKLLELFGLTQYYPFEDSDRAFEALKTHVLEQLVTLEAKCQPKEYIPNTEQWLIQFFGLDCTRALAILAPFKENPVTAKMIEQIDVLKNRRDETINAVEALAQTLHQCFPKHPEIIRKVTSCFDANNDRAYKTLEKNHFTSEAYPDLKKVYKQFFDWYIKWKEIYQEFGVAGDPFHELLSLLNPKQQSNIPTFEPPRDDWNGLQTSDINLTIYSLNDLRAEHGCYRGALFFGKDIIGSNFDDGDFTHANFIHTRIGHRDNEEQFTSFRRGILKHSQWQGAHLFAANFDGCDLCNANFSGVTTQDASFDGITVNDSTSFKKADLTGAKFNNVTKDGKLLSHDEVIQWLRKQGAYGDFTIDEIGAQLAKITLSKPQRRLSVRERSQKFEKQALAAQPAAPTDPSAPTLTARPNALTPQTSRRRLATLGRAPQPDPEQKSTSFLPSFKSVFSHDDLDWHSKKIKLSFLTETFVHTEPAIEKQFQTCREHLHITQKGVTASKLEKVINKFNTCMADPSINKCRELDSQIKKHCDQDTQQAFTNFRDAYKEFVRLHKEHNKTPKDKGGFSLPLSPRKRAATVK